MPAYRLYCMNGNGHIAQGEWFEANSDDEAIIFARMKKLDVACEIWERDRLVKRIAAQAP